MKLLVTWVRYRQFGGNLFEDFRSNLFSNLFFVGTSFIIYVFKFWTQFTET